MFSDIGLDVRCQRFQIDFGGNYFVGFPLILVLETLETSVQEEICQKKCWKSFSTGENKFDFLSYSEASRD